MRFHLIGWPTLVHALDAQAHFYELFSLIWGTEILRLMAEVAEKYGIADPHALDGGSFSEKERRVLLRLYDKWGRSKSDDDARAYLEQKAKFISKRSSCGK